MGRSDSVFTIAVILGTGFPAILFERVGRIPPLAKSMGQEFLDKELQQIVQDAELGRRYADKLVKVWARDGCETWVLIHVEVQGEAESGFAERMYVYHYRLFDRYRE